LSSECNAKEALTYAGRFYLSRPPVLKDETGNFFHAKYRLNYSMVYFLYFHKIDIALNQCHRIIKEEVKLGETS